MELSPDEEKNIPPVPIKTYQWEDLRRAREAGGYPWTHLLKVPLQEEITAEDIIRSTTPKRSMSREFSRSRTHSPVVGDVQKILNLDSSPGSSRKHDDDGRDEGVHIPNFSKEISLDSEDDFLNKKTMSKSSINLVTSTEIPKNISPKSILKRRAPDPQYIGVTETREKTKCCHPLVNKIKHLADKTLQKLDKVESEKSPVSKRKRNEESQEIRQLKNSPSAVRRQKFSAIKLGDSDEVSKTICVDTPPPRKRKEHIYEDIDDTKGISLENLQNISQDKVEELHKDNDIHVEKRSTKSYDPSLVAEDTYSLKEEEHVMEILHKNIDQHRKEVIITEDDHDIAEEAVHQETPNTYNTSHNITITEITDDESTSNMEQSSTVPIEVSPSPSPREIQRKRKEEFQDNDWSKPSSDHEYEIIEKPPPNITYTAPSVDEKPNMVKTEDEMSSTSSLERKYLQNQSDDEEIDSKENINEDTKDSAMSAEALQKDIEERFFVNTPSTVSRTECEISTSQVDSSALENLPLKRDSRTKNGENIDSKIQQRLKEGTGKLKSQAGKLRTKINSMKMPDRPKFKMPERPKFSFPDKSKFTLPERSKIKSFNIKERFSLGERRKFSLPERPKFNVPEFPKFKMPERLLTNFQSLGRKKEYKVDDNTESTSDLQNTATVDFEVKTYPRLFSKKKKTPLPKTSSSPTLNREDTPPPTFTFTRMKKPIEETAYDPERSEEPREYGSIDNKDDFTSDTVEKKQFETTYDFDRMPSYDYEEEEQEFQNTENSHPGSQLMPNQEFTHINEINKDEFFVRPRGISRENIQVREYLSDEIRQAFQTPQNVLVTMGTDSRDDDHMYANDLDVDNDIIDDENIKYSTEDINERDDGYYTFPPVRPSRAKRKKKETDSIKYIDDSVNASMQFSEVDLGMSDDLDDQPMNDNLQSHVNQEFSDFPPPTDLRSIHEYANDEIIEYPDQLVQSQTLPMPPKRKKKFGKQDTNSSLNTFDSLTLPENFEKPQDRSEDIIVYRTEHEYTVPQAESAIDPSPAPPKRTRSRSSREPSLYDDDRTSRGADSLILDTNLPPASDIDGRSESCHESPGYATVDKGGNQQIKTARRSKSKTPPRRRKSNSSERKYYTVGSSKTVVPNRPPRKKSSISLTTLDSFARRSISGDFTQYDEIDEPQVEDVHKDLKSGKILNKMKDRPLPPPPRPPRGPRKKKNSSVDGLNELDQIMDIESPLTTSPSPYLSSELHQSDIVEIEVSTQTDPLPDDVEFDIEENLNISMSSSLRDLVNEDSMLGKLSDKTGSRPTSRSEKSLKLSDPKISGLGRSSPTVILVEKRVSSPTRINERDEMLTEASLTVQPIDVDQRETPEVPPFPKSRKSSAPKPAAVTLSDRTVERISVETSRDVQLDNLVTQRLQVRDLDVGRLNVSELQATKILVSDIEGMTLQVNELDSKSGHISVSGIEFSQSVIDEIAKKFAEMTAVSSNQVIITQAQPSVAQIPSTPKTENKEEETQTEASQEETKKESKIVENIDDDSLSVTCAPPLSIEENIPPQRPPPPDLTPLLYSYLQDLASPPPQIYFPRNLPPTNLSEALHTTPAPPLRRSKRKPAAALSESSSDDSRPRPSPRRMPVPVRAQEPTITEAGAQFLRVCHNSITRAVRNLYTSFMNYVHGAQDKKDVQMAMVICLVLVAGLIMFGLSDSRAVHHHHWEFFNPPDIPQ